MIFLSFSKRKAFNKLLNQKKKNYSKIVKFHKIRLRKKKKIINSKNQFSSC